MDAATLKLLIRTRCGNPSTTELTDVTIVAESTFILNEIAKWIPVKVLRYITSTVNGREYTVHANTMRVQYVFPWNAVDEEMMVLGGWKVNSVEGNEYYNFPSIWVLDKMRQLRGMPKIRFTFNPVERILKIDPYPEEAGYRYYYISIEKALWTVAALPTDFENTLVTGCVWKCLASILLYRSGLGGVQRQGGFVEYPAMNMNPLVEALKKEFYDELALKSKLYFS